MKQIICVDTGTTNIKIAQVDEVGRVTADRSIPMRYTDASGCLFDARVVFDQVCAGIREVVAASPVSQDEVVALSFTGQRASVIPLAEDFSPCGAGVTWQDVQCDGAAGAFYRHLGGGEFGRLTGLPESSIWTIAKLVAGNATYGWPDKPRYYALLHDFLLKQFGADGFYTDHSNASVTGLYDSRGRCWSRELLEPVGLSEEQLPEILEAGARAGRLRASVAGRCGLPRTVELLVGAGDQQCATLGGGGVREGDVVLCLGTAAILNCPVAAPVGAGESGAFCSAHAVKGMWVLEFIHNAFGTSLNWCAEMMGVADQWSFLALAAQAPAGSRGVLYFPFLAGIGSPELNAAVRGGFVGLSMNHQQADMARAVVEGLSFELRRILERVAARCAEGGIKVVGGAAENTFLMQVLAGVTGRRLIKLSTGETTILGLAALMWTGLGAFENLDEALASFSAAEEGIEIPQSIPEYERTYQRYVSQLELIKQMDGEL